VNRRWPQIEKTAPTQSLTTVNVEMQKLAGDSSPMGLTVLASDAEPEREEFRNNRARSEAFGRARLSTFGSELDAICAPTATSGTALRVREVCRIRQERLPLFSVKELKRQRPSRFVCCSEIAWPDSET